MIPTAHGALRVVGAAWIRDGRLFGARRGPGRRNAGYWELPGGKVDPGEDDREALARELQEELGIHATIGPLLACCVHKYSHGRIHLFVYSCTSKDTPVLRDHDAVRWFESEALDTVRWSGADVHPVRDISIHLQTLKALPNP